MYGQAGCRPLVRLCLCRGRQGGTEGENGRVIGADMGVKALATWPHCKVCVQNYGKRHNSVAQFKHGVLAFCTPQNHGGAGTIMPAPIGRIFRSA